MSTEATTPATEMDSIVSKLNEQLAPLFTGNFFEAYVWSGLGKSISIRFTVEEKDKWPHTYFENATGLRLMIHPLRGMKYEIHLLNCSTIALAKLGIKKPLQKNGLTGEELIKYLVKYFNGVAAALNPDAPKAEKKAASPAGILFHVTAMNETLAAGNAKGYNAALKNALKEAAIVSPRVSIINSYNFPDCYVGAYAEIPNELRIEAAVAVYGEQEREAVKNNTDINYGNIRSSHTTLTAKQWIPALERYAQHLLISATR